MIWFVKLKGLLARVLFITHGVITIWRVTDVYDEPIYYLLLVPIVLLIVELILTMQITKSGEWKW